MRRLFHLCLAAALGALAGLVPPAQARVNVVTLPGRDSTQLTIYNSADLTLVRETRHLTFRKGLNRLEFSWANTLIDPTSVEFRVLNHADQVEVLDVSFPPRVANTLEWRIQSEVAGDVVAEIRYFTSGITWSADYVAEAAREERTMALSGYVRVVNRSGEDYENAQIRLVVGVVKLVEEIRRLATIQDESLRLEESRKSAVVANFAKRKDLSGEKLFFRSSGIGGALAESVDKLESAPREILKEGASEYFLYTVEGRDTIPNGWTRRRISFAVPAVPVVSFCKYERETWGDVVQRYYRFTNAVPSHLGTEPLPDGTVQSFRATTPDGLLAYGGKSNVKYIPVGETVDLELGPDREVFIVPRLMNWVKEDLRFDNHNNVAGWTVRETWEIELQNAREIPVVVDVRRNFQGDWSLKTTAPYEKVDANKVKFLRTLPARSKEKLTYELVTNQGLNATR